MRPLTAVSSSLVKRQGNGEMQHLIPSLSVTYWRDSPQKDCTDSDSAEKPFSTKILDEEKSLTKR
jgi:hypothetical protein